MAKGLKSILKSLVILRILQSIRCSQLTLKNRTGGTRRNIKMHLKCAIACRSLWVLVPINEYHGELRADLVLLEKSEYESIKTRKRKPIAIPLFIGTMEIYRLPPEAKILY